MKIKQLMTSIINTKWSINRNSLYFFSLSSIFVGNWHFKHMHQSFLKDIVRLYVLTYWALQQMNRWNDPPNIGKVQSTLWGFRQLIIFFYRSNLQTMWYRSNRTVNFGYAKETYATCKFSYIYILIYFYIIFVHNLFFLL